MFGLSAEAIGGALCKKERNWIKTIFQCLIGRKLIFQLLKNNNRKRHWRIVWLLPLPFPKKKQHFRIALHLELYGFIKHEIKRDFQTCFPPLSHCALCLCIRTLADCFMIKRLCECVILVVCAKPLFRWKKKQKKWFTKTFFFRLIQVE